MAELGKVMPAPKARRFLLPYAVSLSQTLRSGKKLACHWWVWCFTPPRSTVSLTAYASEENGLPSLPYSSVGSTNELLKKNSSRGWMPIASGR